MKYEKLAILIPSLNPNDKLLKVVETLKKNDFKHIFIVDDGSDSKNIFSKVDVSKILVNNKNMGKGYSLKKGIKYIGTQEYEGVITIDDDMQQDIKDIIKIANSFLEKKAIYLGVRDFKKAPIIRKYANKISSYIFKKIYKKKITDTQTGLRCYPKEEFENLTKINGDRFEYEMNVLKFLAINNKEVYEVPIKTIYNGNGSHFNAIKDSYKIMKVIIDKNNI